jgi:DNA-binding CsgD family transcriptional regulator
VDEDILTAIGTMYEAVTDDSRWLDVLHRLADATASQAANLWVVDPSAPHKHPAFTFINFDPAGVAEYLAHAASMDPHPQYVVAHPGLRIVHDGLYLTDKDIDHHPYYDWQAHFSDVRYRIVGQTGPSSAIHAGVTLHRTQRTGRYDPQDIQRFTALYNHLEKALLMASQFGFLGSLQQWSEKVLDRYTLGMILLDHRSRLIYANKLAETIAGQGDGVRLSEDGLVLARPDDNKKLQSLISRATGADHSAACIGGTMHVPRSSKKQPYFLTVSPASGYQTLLSTRWPAVTVTIKDPGSQVPLPTQHLQTVFRLTRAEVELANALAGGLSLRNAAEKLGIQYGTARTRLAVIFQKTQTRRQSELMKLLLEIFPIG